MCVHVEAVLEAMPIEKGNLTEGSKKVFLAFAKDMTEQSEKIKMLNNEIQEVKKDVNELAINVSNIDGKIDTIKELIESRLNSNVDEERLVGAVTTRLFRSKKVWFLLSVVLCLFILAGVAISYIIIDPNTSNNIATLANSLK